MDIKSIMKELKSKRTWYRVVEIWKRGYYKNKEKGILFGEPVPPDDILPLRIATTLTLTIVALVMILASSFYFGLFPKMGNSLLAILLILIIILPKIIRSHCKE